MEIKGKKVYLVAIEWDGNQPPATWYRRLHKLGLVVQGSKDVGPIERRATVTDQGSGVIYQEGNIMLTSLTLARTLAHLALDHGAVNVDLGEFEALERVTMTRRDRTFLDRIGRTYGRRGRPPAKRHWVISCHECLETSTAEAPEAVRCHNCGGMDINARPGQPVRYKWKGTTNWDAWTFTRFQGPHWEPATIDEAGADPAFSMELIERVEADPVWEILGQSEIAEQINAMDPATAAQLLDACYCALKFRTREERERDRLRAIVEYYRIGNTKPAPVAEPEDPDLFVAAGLLDPTFTALAYQEARES